MNKKTFFNNYFEEIRNLEAFVELTSLGLEYTKKIDIEIINEVSATTSDNKSTTNKSNKNTVLKKAKLFAVEQEENGFPYLYNLVTMRTYGILESAVDDYVVNFINDCENLNEFEYIRKLKGTLVDFISMSKMEQSQHIVNISKQETGTNLKLGIGKFESLLKIIDLNGEVEDVISKQIIELSQIRNVLVHKNGIVDSKLIDKCPWLNLNIGDKIKTNHASFSRYSRAVACYFIKIIERNSLKSKHSEKHMNELQESYDKHLKTILRNIKK